jgi:5-amino-6-(5-phospho-D-ribitylamino)uracil phosphatase
MQIKLLALDIDGTLLTSRGELTPRNRAALAEARKMGVETILLTGRRFVSAYSLMQEVGLDMPLICHNGALTKEIRTLETLALHPLKIEIACEVIRAARHYGTDMVCSCDEERGFGTMITEGISETNSSLRRYLNRYRDSLVEVTDLIEHIKHPPIQLMFSGPCAEMDEFAAHLQSALGGRIRVFKTRYPQFDLTILDAVDILVSKGDSLARVADQYGIASQEMMAIGDNHNDLTMLHYAGLGIVMANAEEELKQLGFALTSSNDEDGVAEAIEKFILSKE